MCYPRQTESGQLISADQMVSGLEHLLSQHRMLFLNGAIGDDDGGMLSRACTSAPEVASILFTLDSMNHQPIKLVINSPGGMLDTTFMILDLFKSVKSPIYTFALFAASAAVLIFAAGDKRYLAPHSKVMLHLPSARLAGNTVDLAIQGREVDKAKNTMIDFLQSFGVKKTKSEILTDIDREKWMTAEETIEYGLGDEIISGSTLSKWLKKPTETNRR